MKELNEKLEDKQSSIEAKGVVWNLEEKVKELERENMELRCKLDRSKQNTHNTTGKCIGDMILIPYSWKNWQGIKFGGLAVYLVTTKLKSTNISYVYTCIHTCDYPVPNHQI